MPKGRQEPWSVPEWSRAQWRQRDHFPSFLGATPDSRISVRTWTKGGNFDAGCFTDVRHVPRTCCFEATIQGTMNRPFSTELRTTRFRI
ncbi:hypothetical protein KM043_015462 [Ampulex compressa]|nr:hypothetical protein KM043_015462 [Ampulex compressa]